MTLNTTCEDDSPNTNKVQPVHDQATAENERAFLLHLLDSSLNEIYVFDSQTLRFQYVNSGALRNLGYSHEHIKTITPVELMPEFDQESLREFLSALAHHEQEKLVFQTFYRRADQSIYPVEVHLQLHEHEGKESFLAIASDISQRRQTEMSLREGEQQYRRLVETLHEGIWMIDKSGCTTFVNDRMAEMLGYAPTEMTGKHLFAFIDPERIEIAKRNLHRREEGISEQHDFEFVCKDGSHLHTVIATGPITDLGGEYCGSIAGVIDITERRRAEEALRESEFFLKKSQSVARIGSYYFNARTGTWKSSAVLDEIFGIDESYPKNIDGWVAFVHPDYRKEMRTYLEQYVVAGCNRFEKEYRIIRQSDHQERWVLGLGELEFAPDGTTVAMIGTIQDITERKQAEQALQMFQCSTDQAGDAIFWIDRDGGFSYVNAQACRSLGYTFEELTRMRLWDIDPVYPRERWYTNWESYQQNKQGGGESIETLHRRKDGTLFPVEVYSKHIWFGDTEFHVAAIRNITDRKQAEAALRDSEERFKLLADSSFEGIAFTQGDIFVDLNDQLAAMFGYNRDELVGKSFVGLVAPESLDALTEALLCNTNDRYEYTGLCKDGRKILIEARARLATIGGRQVRITVLRDITQQRELEQQSRQWAERLQALTRNIHSAREHERKRIAMDLHDELGQRLTATKIELGIVKKGIQKIGVDRADTSTKLLQQLDLVAEQVNQAITAIQRMATELRPDVLDTFGLPEAIRWQAGEFERWSGVRCRNEIPATVAEMDEDVKTVMFRVCQEALTNVARHAKATEVEVHLRDEGPSVVLEVSDNGRGIDLDKLHDRTALGVMGIQERVKMFGGTTRFDLRRSGGTTVTVTLPRKFDLAVRS